jgi:hypothetical protein
LDLTVGKDMFRGAEVGSDFNRDGFPMDMLDYTMHLPGLISITYVFQYYLQKKKKYNTPSIPMNKPLSSSCFIFDQNYSKYIKIFNIKLVSLENIFQCDSNNISMSYIPEILLFNLLAPNSP